MKKLCLIFIAIYSIGAIANNKVVYGVDNRVDVLDSSAQYQTLAASTLAMVAKEKMQQDGDSFILTGPTLGERKNLCKDERFYNQIAPATCSSFLVADDIVVTAGHCIKNQVDCDRFSFVFGFYQQDPEQRVFKFAQDQVFNCKEVLEQRKTNMLDYSVIRLDRKTGRTPLKFRRSGKIKKKTPVLIIGQPSGMPTKISDGGKVRSNFWSGFFTSSVDSFGGNSGSAVINKKTFEVEGILVRGEIDYVEDRANGCMRVKVCKENRCQGEAATRITKIPYLKNMIDE
jgi:V8-like Glu-specific endopeptidase